jgi:NADH dehydrogenase
VEIQLGAMVTDVDRNGINVKYGDGREERIECQTKVWSAGVAASPLGKLIADQTGAEVDRAGRVKVLPDLTVPGHPEVFVVGDMALVEGVPGQAQGAIQGSRYAAKLVKAELKGANPDFRQPFKYFDKGSMATVSRYSAVVKVGPLEFGGFIGWLSWLFLHLLYLVGFKARLTTALSWIGTFVGSHRGQLTITEQQAYARTRIEQLEEIVESVEEEAAEVPQVSVY